MMKPAEILREIAYPATDLAVLFAMVGFLLLGKLAAVAGLLGLWLGLILLPAFFRYLLYILEARAAHREVPPLAVELFGWAENFWSLFPLFLIAITIWGGVLLAQNFTHAVALFFGLVFVLIFPASMAVLAITRSPLESLKPSAWVQLVRVCGLDYALVFLVIAVPGAIPLILMAADLPRFMVEMSMLYLVFLFFTFTGAVVARSGANAMISIPDPVELRPDEVEARTDTERQAILDHAYGFISRNDRAGGLAHLQTYVDSAPNPTAEYHWFFDQMLHWEARDEALFFAQRYLTHLLDINAQIDVLKLIARCRLENERFRPLPQDRERALDIAQRLQHEELTKILKEN